MCTVYMWRNLLNRDAFSSPLWTSFINIYLYSWGTVRHFISFLASHWYPVKRLAQHAIISPFKMAMWTLQDMWPFFRQEKRTWIWKTRKICLEQLGSFWNEYTDFIHSNDRLVIYDLHWFMLVYWWWCLVFPVQPIVLCPPPSLVHYGTDYHMSYFLPSSNKDSGFVYDTLLSYEWYSNQTRTFEFAK